jgi:hypothetical protein
MRLIALAAFLAAVVTAVTGPAAWVTYARPLTSIITVETVFVELTPEEYRTIYQGLEDTFNFERNQIARKCVDYEEELAPLALTQDRRPDRRGCPG